MRPRHTVWALLPAALLVTVVLSHDNGTIPGLRSIPIDAAQRAPACLACHSGSFGRNSVDVVLATPNRSLDQSESLSLTMNIAGGPSGSSGGFVVENTAGAFSAGSGQIINTSGRAGQFVSHANARSRAWNLAYTAPGSPGLVRLFAVGLAANNNGDGVGFHGHDSAATVVTPLYLGVNAPGNRRFGQACVGSYGNWAVLYSDQTPTVGNQAYAVKVAGAAPSSSVLFLIGTPRAVPLPLDLIGATGCSLWVDQLVIVQTATGTGHPQRGEGTATAPLPLPNNRFLRGAILAAQAAVVDTANGRNLPITMTEGLLISIQ